MSLVDRLVLLSDICARFTAAGNLPVNNPGADESFLAPSFSLDLSQQDSSRRMTPLTATWVRNRSVQLGKTVSTRPRCCD